MVILSVTPPCGHVGQVKLLEKYRTESTASPMLQNQNFIYRLYSVPEFYCRGSGSRLHSIERTVSECALSLRL